MSKKVSRRYEEQAQEIRQRLGDRPYSIGLDLGVGSIGVAVAAYDLISTNKAYHQRDMCSPHYRAHSHGYPKSTTRYTKKPGND